MIIELFDDCSQIFRLDNFTELNPSRPQKGELINASDKNLNIDKIVHPSLIAFFPVPLVQARTHRD
jgi:hypothetical protein